jgi:D-3-phosphoglycerate dehydrogenase
MSKNSKPKWLVFIGSRSFGKAFPEHIGQLEKAGCEVYPNTVGRAYRAEELLKLLPGKDAIITGTDELTADVINAADRLKTIVKHGVGLETIDLDAARARGIVVSATPGIIHDSVADLTLALLLVVARNIVSSHLSTRAGSWKPTFGTELKDKVLGIVGLGRIGKAVCQRAQAFGMKVIAYDPYPDREYAAAHSVELVPLEALLSSSDVVTLHAPAESARTPLIGAPELRSMKESAILINTARGKLVDENALATALKERHLAGAGLDTFVNEPPVGSALLELENVVLTPHLGGRTIDGLRRLGEFTIENCLRALRGEPPLFQVEIREGVGDL